MKIKINNNLNFKSEGPPLLIAEISANHCGSKNSFLKHILYAKKSGADLVKIQSYETIDMTINNKFVIKSGTWKGLNISNLYKKAQTPFDWHYDAFELAKKKKYVCSVLHLV
jgi:sialic acid synthase SpsE